MAKEERQLVTPGEVIINDSEYLPGEGTEKRGEEIIAQKFGLVEISNRLVRIIPLSGTYIPRRGNVVIGEVRDITFNGWLIDIGAPSSGFLPLMECPRFINKDEIGEFMGIGDVVVAKLLNAKIKSIDLTIKIKGLGKLEGGMVIKINSHKVPRVIGKEGSMINIIQDATQCEIVVGQNGLVWINGKSIADEILAKKAIMFVSDNSYLEGLTEKLQAWLVEQK